MYIVQQHINLHTRIYWVPSWVLLEAFILITPNSNYKIYYKFIREGKNFAPNFSTRQK